MTEYQTIIIIVTLLNVIVGALYLRYALIPQNRIAKFLIKWIPAAFLSAQSVFLTIARTQNDNSICSALFAVGYGLCACGDILLVFSSGKAFYLGMTVFAIAYTVMAVARFDQLVTTFSSVHAIVSLVLIATLTVIVLRYIVRLLQMHLPVGNKRKIFIMAVILYAVIMAGVATSALLDLMLTKTADALVSFTGVFLFLASDTVLIINKVGKRSLALDIIVIITYWSGLTMVGATCWRDFN